MTETNPETSDKELAYDLRQVWVKLVGIQLEQVQEAKKKEALKIYYDEIEDLYDLIQQKFLDKEETINSFETLRNDIIILANQNRSAWLGTSQNNESIATIERKLRNMERFLYDNMEKANMYGGKFDDEGL